MYDPPDFAFAIADRITELTQRLDTCLFQGHEYTLAQKPSQHRSWFEDCLNVCFYVNGQANVWFEINIGDDFFEGFRCENNTEIRERFSLESPESTQSIIQFLSKVGIMITAEEF